MKNFIQTADIVSKYKNKNILISGGLGYIGSSLAFSLFDIDCKIILLNKSIEKVEMFKNQIADVSFVKGDVSNCKTWEGLLEGVDYFFHLAPPPRCPEYRCYYCHVS